MDASYGHNSKLRQDLTGLRLSYVAAIQSTTKVCEVREDDPKPPRVSVEELALSLPKRAWRTVAWRQGANVTLRSRFARVRVRAASIRGEAGFDEETLLIEWPLCRTRHMGHYAVRQTMPSGSGRNRGCRGAVVQRTHVVSAPFGIVF
jgi:DDE superfamily endonuclease